MEKDIVIVGAGLTGLTLAYYLKQAGKNIQLLEKQDRTGGVIHSITENGFTYETGPSTGVVSSLEIAELFEDLANKCEPEIAEKSAEIRYILRNGKWTALPSGLFSAIGTPLFSLYDKFRILGEPFRKPGTNPDESIAELVKHRLGQTYLDYAVDPFISGVYAGDPNKLITRYALPKLYNLEQNYGSFIKGSIKKAKEPKPQGSEKITKKVFSLKGGLSALTDAMTEKIGNEFISTSCENIKIAPAKTGFQISYTNSENKNIEIQAKQVITTIGGYALPEVLPFIPNEIIKPIKNTNYAKVVQAAVGFNNWNGKPLVGFGGLVPGKEKRNMLGILYPSAIFKNRAPENGALLSVFMGGSRHPEMLDKSDEELKTIIIQEIESTLGKQNKPDLVRIFRHEHAIAQYDITTGKRLEAIQQIENQYKGLILAGSIRDGIGMSDRVKQAKQLADLLIKE